MDNTNSGINSERLLEQIVLLNPTLKYKPEKLSVLRKRMEDQLLGEAVVQIEHMEPLYDKWEERVKQQIYHLKRFLKEDDDENKSQTKASDEEIKEEIQRGSSDDDESLIIRRSRHHNGNAKRIRDESSERGYLFDKYEDVPLSLRRTPRKRKRSSKYISPAKSKRSYHSNNSVSFHRKGNHHHKNLREDSTVSTSGIIHHCEQENVFSEQGTSSRTFHLKIPSLFKSDFHEINFSELEITRRVIDARAQAAKERILQKSLHPPPPHSKKKRSYKRRPSISMVTSITDSGSDQREREEAELSQLINDVIGTTGSEEETWRATNALENINNEIIDNYSVLPHTSTHSQPEFLGFDNEKSAKRRYTKSSNKAIKEKQPPKKRGRKPKTQQYFSQPPTKSNLAAYVESFGNECDMRGSQTPAGSSTRSQPLVSSTTQNFELVDQQHEPSPVMYYLHGNWQSGDPCQLLTTDVNLATAGSQLPTNNLNISYDESARVAGINLPIITPFRQHNTLDNSIVLPVMTEGFITTALQPLPTSTNATARNESIPPPAHKSSEILDLSIKTSSQFSSNPISSVHNNVIVHADVSFGCPMAIMAENENDDSPLDLSINANQNNSTSSCDQEYGILTETQCCTEVDNGQDDEFIRRLIETSDFDLGLDQLPEGNENSSFKAALDMPLLDTIDDVGENNMLKETSSVLPTNDSTYASMPEDSSSFLNCSLGDDYNFTDESTREIFKQLLDVEPLTSATTPTATTDEGGRANKEEEEAETIHSDRSLRTDNENPSEEDKATKETVAEKTATDMKDADKDVLKEVSNPQEKNQRQKEPEVAMEKEQFPSPKNTGLNMSTSSIINCAGKIRKRRITVTSAADPSPKLAKMQREQITITITSGGENESIFNDKNEGKATFDLSKNIDTAPINLKKQTEHRATTFTECRNEICIKELNTNKSDISPSIQDNSKSLCSIDDEENKFTQEKKVVQEACKELSTSHKKDADGGVVVNATTKFINKAKPRMFSICEEIKHNETNNIIVITIPEHPDIHCNTKDMESAGEEQEEPNKMQSNKKIKNETCETTTKCNDTTKTTDIIKSLKENVKKSNNNTTASLQNTSAEKSKDISKSLDSMLDIAQDNNNNCSNDNIDNTIQLKHDDVDDPSFNICNVTQEIDQPAVSLNLNKLTNDNCLPRQTGNDDGEEDVEMMDCLNITEENIIIDLCKPLNLEKIPESQTEHKESEPVASANKIQSIVNNFHSNEQQQQKQTINTDKDKENISSFHEQQQKVDAIPVNTLNQNGDENIKFDYPYTNESDNVDRKSHQEPLYESSHEKNCQEQPADLICKIEICDRLNSFEKDSSDTFPTLEISESEDEIGTEHSIPEHIDEKLHIDDENISKENGLQKDNFVGKSKELENNGKFENEE
uniref:Uncharacterized protein n=1 Tax=Musca domestica TaxID=7370 RepID=A0A1I8N625_MUSDO